MSRPGKSVEPPTTVHPTSVVSVAASLKGTQPVSVGANSIIQPRARLISTYGPITIGERCIIAERAVLGLQNEATVDGNGVVLKNGVVIESGATVEGSVEEGSLVEVGAMVGKGSMVGKVGRCAHPATFVMFNSIGGTVNSRPGSVLCIRGHSPQQTASGTSADLAIMN